MKEFFPAIRANGCSALILCPEDNGRGGFPSIAWAAGRSYLWQIELLGWVLFDFFVLAESFTNYENQINK